MTTWVTLFTALVAHGCLLTDPPPYEVPQKTRPFLIPVTPALTEIIRVRENGLYEFKAEVRSEDAGERVLIFLLLDYTTNSERQVREWNIDPSTLDEPCPEVGDCRAASLQWQVPSLVGCHSLTLLATHEPNILDKEDCNRATPCFKSMDDVFTLTWWAEIWDDTSPPATLDSCRTPATLAPDGGAP